MSNVRRHYKNNPYIKRKKRLIRPAAVLIAILALLCAGIIGVVSLGGFASLFGADPSVSPSATPYYTGSIEASPTPTPSRAPTPTPSAQQAVIQMMGDILLHDTSRESGKQTDGSYDFSSYFDIIKDQLTGDLVIANLESPVDANLDGTGYSGYPAFNVPREIVPAIKNAGIDLVTTCNNHAFDRGWQGVVNTRITLQNMGLDFVGTYETQAQYDTPKILDVNGIKVGIIAYSDSSNGLLSTIPSEHRGYAMRLFNSSNLDDLPRLLADVEAAKAAGAEFIIFYMHWGAEYQYQPTAGMRSYAQALIENGVDVLMGDHPHCVQPITKKTIQYEGRDKEVLVVYSLGNFFADQIRLSLENQTDDRIRQAMIVDFTIEKDSATGIVSIIDAGYTPTFIHRDTLVSGATPRYAYKVLPAGSYALAETRPSVFDSDEKWQLCKDAWAKVQEVVGTQITPRKG